MYVGIHINSSTTFDSFSLFTGREYDLETGLYFYRIRYYNPSLGRFLQRDPLAFDVSVANLYAYVRNSPVRYTDPLGLYTRDLEPIETQMIKNAIENGRKLANDYEKAGDSAYAALYRLLANNLADRLTRGNIIIDSSVQDDLQAYGQARTVTCQIALAPNIFFAGTVNDQLTPTLFHEEVHKKYFSPLVLAAFPVAWLQAYLMEGILEKAGSVLSWIWGGSITIAPSEILARAAAKPFYDSPSKYSHVIDETGENQKKLDDLKKLDEQERAKEAASKKCAHKESGCGDYRTPPVK